MAFATRVFSEVDQAQPVISQIYQNLCNLLNFLQLTLI
jgi:hypothetical protein